ncbi:MAG: gamma-glutamyltransferase [Candidatus Latescibacteria bacterium]|nr:gamma-glutamyltransferase [Candidatus Latescibacterota bacterium]NIM64477.1 gamma-glutamyltransferase [Candidatus Latescibacterota bacterium]NIO00630.1 gamma-glutamyltransferase [Candidatus Latescibacterota bacterium]NIO27032.1 gamma-glutamyltransferase [Candidatus Latescibacterota bacterium]NIO54557.1 gamma-glutamyltransferase [Candidatus Latescibacterota bacterium]
MTAPLESRFKSIFKALLPIAVIMLVGFSFGWLLEILSSNRADAAGRLISGKTIKVENAVVVAADSIAARVGIEVLLRGGNAVDAAVAVGFALAVTYPRAGNIGGGGFLLVRQSTGGTRFIDYREKAALKAHRDMFLDVEGNVIEDASTKSHLASGVPGTVAGLWLAHQTFGTIPWKDLLEPACRLARDGFPVPPALVESIEKYRDPLSSNEASRRIFLEPLLEPGDLFVQSELAATLERIRAEGPAGFYHGETARYIVSEMEANGGLITEDDLSAYQAVFRKPVKFMYRGYELIGAPLPSSGGIMIAQVLQSLEPLKLSELSFHSPEHVHSMAEAEKIVYRIRAVFLGDSDFYPTPWRSLIEWPYIQRLQKMISPSKALTVSEIESLDLVPPNWREPERMEEGQREPGRMIEGGHEPTGGRGYDQAPSTEVSRYYEHDHTTHFSIVDRWGNAVANTYTLNDSYGSGVTVPGAGFLLNNEMDDFRIKPGHPNIYGLVGGEANAIEPGKRMLSSMSPTIVLDRGRLFLVLGTPGGSRIPTSVFQVISNVIDFGMPLDEAVAAPRVHAQYLPDEIRIEKGALSPEVIAALEAMGHNVVIKKPIGIIQAIHIDRGHFIGASDPRGSGRAIGY